MTNLEKFMLKKHNPETNLDSPIFQNIVFDSMKNIAIIGINLRIIGKSN